jgi:hypothetical protein
MGGVLPVDAQGNFTSLEWRLTIKADDGIVNTFLRSGSDDAERFAGLNQDNITYWDGNNTNKTFVYGRTDLPEEDDEWVYYTFTVTDEALRQLNIKDYDILGIELANISVLRSGKQRVIYSRISGIYKPNGVNFIGHFRIYKNELNSVLLDHLGANLLDHLGNTLYST